MRLSAIGKRAEAAITAKTESDHAGLSAVFPRTAMARFGSAVATRIPALADRAPYNKARGFTLSDQLVLADIVGFHDDVGIRPTIEVSEPHASDQLGDLLSNAGLSPIARGITLHVAPRNVPPLEVAGPQIHEVAQEDRDVYIALLLEAYELPTHATALRQMFAREHAAPGLRRYLAVVDETPAAAAALYPREGTGLLAGAATLPAFRRRGCQSALIAQRLADATADCDLVVATAATDSASQENLVSHGFDTTHRRTLWRRDDQAL